MAYYGNEPAKVALKVGSGVITAEEIQDASISTADIANDAITPNQLDDDGTGFQIGTLGIGAAVSGGHALLVSGSSSISGALTAGSISTGTNGHIDVGDNKSFRAGNGGDLRLMHTGSNSYILNNEGHLILKIDDANENKDIKFELDDGAHTHVMSYDGSTTFAGHIAGTTATFSSDISTSGLITTSIGDSIFGGGEADSRIYITNRGGSSGDDSHFIRGDSQRLSLNAGGSNGEVSLEVNGGQELKILDGSATFSGMTAIGGALDTGSGGTGQLQVVGGQGSQNTLLKLNSASSNEKVRIFLTDATNWSTSIGADTDGDFVVWANGTPSTAGNDRFHVERGGRIGIGNGSPKSHFDFHGKGGISLNSSDVALTNHIYFNDSGDPKKSSASAGSAFYLTGGMCQMYYNSTGSVDAAAGWNLGYKLATDGQSTFYGAITGTSATFAGNVTCASLNVDGAVDFDFGGTSHLNFGNDSGGVHMYVGTDQFFRILGDSGNDEWIRILDGGNVGIGTTSPSSVCTQSKVEIKGLPAFLGLHCDGSDPNGSSGIEFGDSSDGNIGQIHYYHGDNSMNFTTNTGVALSLKNDQSATFAGTVGLNGLTNSSYDSGADDLVLGQTSGNGGLTIVSGTSNVGYINFADGTSGDEKYRGYIYFNHDSGDLGIVNRQSGTSERLIIKSDGALEAPSAIYSKGSEAIAKFDNRVGASTQWGWYATGDVAYLWQSVVGALISVENDGSATFAGGVTINSGSSNKITHNHGSTALEIENQGSKRALYVHSNVDGGQDNPLVEIKADNPAFDQEVLRIHNDGANHSIQVLDDGSEVFSIASGGNVGIGHTTPQYGLTLAQGTSDSGKIGWEDAGNNKRGAIFVSSANDRMEFMTGTSDTVRMSIFSDGLVNINTTSQWNLQCQREDGSSQGMILFTNGSSNVGSITTTQAATYFNTSSDYRLKENEVAISDGITRLKQLKPYRFNFKVTPDTIVDGFFAHEVSSIVPEAIFGVKDAVDENGDIEAQGIDQSKLVPLLVSALQEAIDRIEALENA